MEDEYRQVTKDFDNSSGLNADPFSFFSLPTSLYPGMGSSSSTSSSTPFASDHHSHIPYLPHINDHSSYSNHSDSYSQSQNQSNYPPQFSHSNTSQYAYHPSSSSSHIVGSFDLSPEQLISFDTPASMPLPPSRSELLRNDSRSEISSTIPSSSSLTSVLAPSFNNTQIKSQNSPYLLQTPSNSGYQLRGQDIEVEVEVEVQPPVEVRTRTPSEKRTFSTEIRVLGDYRQMGVKGVFVELCYAVDNNGAQPNQDILGGTKVGIIQDGGRVVFDNLSMSEASTKHKGAEFCLEFVLIGADGQPLPLVRRRSRAFYAYSNQKVLSRRRNIELRALSKTRASTVGGEIMHVIGSPFIPSPSLRCVFHTPHGDVAATNLEMYSESVLFFTLPPYPLPPGLILQDGTEIKAQVLVSNDGRNFSNPIEFTFVVESTHKRLRSRF
eukprot:TRINITY_DN2273_c0_g3_i1.p1 TRINITY_DN2273_c0_g3~~TRINITY_DN2273_c0_g3_i1.p1  ORF type:complete len:438 (+),score=76.33 TRINITY_DN2273_c0_g3_i1:260-1573(+)